jgi:hypothetical protein
MKRASGLYHAESSQEDFLVLAGTCLLLIEEHEAYAGFPRWELGGPDEPAKLPWT